MDFPCKACGACCRNVGGFAALNRGDGTCRHYDDAARLCTIYATRPLVCRIDRYYEQRLRPQLRPETFYALQARTCVALDATNTEVPALVAAALAADGVQDTSLRVSDAEFAQAVAAVTRAVQADDFFPLQPQ